jgi:predicted amidohydrolase YtcJ
MTMVAEIIITNAKVLTMDEARPRAEAVALAGGRILAVGSRGEVEALAGPGCKVVDAGGRTLLPGFVESHMHLFGGAELQHLQLTGVHGMAALAEAFARFAAANPDAAGPDGGRGGLRADRSADDPGRSGSRAGRPPDRDPGDGSPHGLGQYRLSGAVGPFARGTDAGGT